MGSDFQTFQPLQPQGSGNQSRMLLATGLCLGILFLYSWMMPKPAPLPPSSAPPAPALPVPAPAPAVVPAGAETEPSWTGELKGGDLLAVVTNEGAGITAVTCLRNHAAAVAYDSAAFQVPEGLPPLLAVAAADGGLSWTHRWKKVDCDASSVTFETVLPNGLRLGKKITLPESGYLIRMAFEGASDAEAPASLAPEVLILGPREDLPGPGASAQHVSGLLERPDGSCVVNREQAVTLVKKGAWSPPKGVPNKDALPVRWGGVTGSYFAVMARVAEGRFAAMQARPYWKDPAAAQDDDKRDAATDPVGVVASMAPWSLAPGERRSATVLCYVGPKKEDVLAAADKALPDILDWGFLGLSKPLMAVLGFVHRVTGNYGVAIIGLTLLVRLAIYPLSRMGQISMMTTSHKMKRLQPRLDEVKKRHKSNAKKLMEEQTKVMREEGMTPFSPMIGCLPMLPQIPIFIALYHLLQGAVELRGSPFCLWIRDLARPDTVLSGIPLIGVLNPLPIVYCALTIYQMWRAPKPPDPQMAQQQKMMMFIMPVMFGFMLYSMPAGLTLYWITSTTFSIGEQAYIRRLLKARGVLPA
jgi:YidC/Oxa1 family membrane protein insertase